MNKLTIFIILLFGFFISCSSSDDDGSMMDEDPQSTNGFNFNGMFYPTQFTEASLETLASNDTSVSMSISNSDPNDLSSMTGRNFVFLDFLAEDIEAGTYNLSDFIQYQIVINATSENSMLLNGDDILFSNSDLFANTGSITINSVSDTTIDLEYTFTRDDGQVISGSYSGEYID